MIISLPSSLMCIILCEDREIAHAINYAKIILFSTYAHDCICVYMHTPHNREGVENYVDLHIENI